MAVAAEVMRAVQASLDRRMMLMLVGGLVAAPHAAALPSRDLRWDAIVSKSGRQGTVDTVAAALLLARRAGKPFRILIERGIYMEKLQIDVPDVTIRGEGEDSIISFGAAAGLLDPQGRPWGTGGSATVTVTAPGVTLSDLTVRNSFDYLDNRRTDAVKGAQAVALSLAPGADRSLVRRCVIEGYQDTLYVREGRALFAHCRISGTVDFIFGGAAAVFDRCEIRSRAIPGAELQGYLAAPSTPIGQAVGLVFSKCRLSREADVPDESVYLGRPWRAGGNMQLLGAAAFIECWMDKHIRTDGWTSMGYRDPAGISRQLTPQEARLFEWGSKGPGAHAPNPTRRMLDRSELVRFGQPAMFGDWRPTGQ
jgi:pectinesterase